MAEGRHRRGDRPRDDDLLPEAYGRHWAGDEDAGAHDDYVHDDYVHDDYAEDGYDDDGYADAGYGDQPDPVGRGRGAGGRGGRRSYRRRHPVLTALFLIALVVVVLIAAGAWWASGKIDPGGRQGRAVAVTIPAGSSSHQIGDLLVKAGVIHGSGTLFAYYARLQGAGAMLAGSYSLPTNESYQSAITALEAGPRIVTEKLVIPEGFTLRQIAARVGALPHMGFSAASFLSLSSSGSVRSPYEPNGVNDLEGLVFPATYTVQVGQTSEVDLLTEMVSTFDSYASEIGLAGAAAAHHLTGYQLITAASIVQGEAKLDGDRPRVASVIYNRLSAGMTLGADSTLIYALRLHHPDLNLATVDYEQPSPYNTRLHTGLPPTPIDSPGLPSLRAMVSPASTTYLYFVEINPDGQLGFATTSAGFAQLQAECQAAKLC